MINRYSSTVEELSIVEIITNLSWEPLTKRREAHVVSLVKKTMHQKRCAYSYLQNYFELRNLNFRATAQRPRTELFVLEIHSAE